MLTRLLEEVAADRRAVLRGSLSVDKARLAWDRRYQEERAIADAMAARQTVREVAAAYVAATTKPNAQAKRRSVVAHQILAYWRDELLRAVTIDRLDAWERWLRERYRTNTVRVAWELLRAAVRQHAADPARLEWLSWMPKLGDGEEPDARTFERASSLREVVALLWAACERDAKNLHRGVPLCDFTRRIAWLLLVGVRKGEGAAHVFADVDDEGILTTARQIIDGGKGAEPLTGGRKNRRAYRTRLHPCALFVLEWQREDLERLGWYHGPDTAIFPNRAGMLRRTTELVRPPHIKELAEAADLPNVVDWVTHSLRHTWAHLEGRGGASVVDVQQRGGWSTLRMAEHYARAGGRSLPHSFIGGGHLVPDEQKDLDDRELMAELLEMRAQLAHAVATIPKSKWGRRQRPRGGPAPIITHEDMSEGTERRRRELAELRPLTWQKLARLYVASEAKGAAKGTKASAAMRRLAREVAHRCKRAGGTAYGDALRLTNNRDEARKKSRLAYHLACSYWRRCLRKARAELTGEVPDELTAEAPDDVTAELLGEVPADVPSEPAA